VVAALIALPIYTNATHQRLATAQAAEPQNAADSNSSDSAATNTTAVNSPTAAATSTSSATSTTVVNSTSTGAAPGQQPTSASSTAQPDLFHTADTVSTSSASTVSLVEKAFQASDATAAQSEIHSWDVINHQFESMQELAGITGRILQDFPVQNAKIVKQKDKTEHFYEIYGQRPAGESATVVLSSFKFPNQPSQTILIVRDDSEKPNMAQFTREYEQMGATLRTLGYTPEISACIKGFTNDRISGGSKVSYENQVFQSVQAREIEGINTQNVISLSAYSPNCSNYILSDNRKMNLQLGLHYDSVRKQTEIILGAPFITITY